MTLIYIDIDIDIDMSRRTKRILLKMMDRSMKNSSSRGLISGVVLIVMVKQWFGVVRRPRWGLNPDLIYSFRPTV